MAFGGGRGRGGGMLQKDLCAHTLCLIFEQHAALKGGTGEVCGLSVEDKSDSGRTFLPPTGTRVKTREARVHS